jgi:PAS domain S-box-containing protein
VRTGRIDGFVTAGIGMGKYTDKQKLEAVAACRKGTGGLLATAKAQGLHVDSLRKWVAGYSASGAAGAVAKKRSYYDPEFKMQVLRRVKDEGISCRQPSTLHEPRDWTYVRKDGSRVTVSLVMTAMQGDDGRVSGYLGIAHDVTRQKAHEESLRQAMHAARKASLAKSEFLANMSHEIRTPMNALIGLSYLLEQTDLDVEQKDYLDKIGLASKSLLALIDDILDLSKVEAGELRLERVPFRLDHLLQNLGDVMGVHADAKGIALTIDAGHAVPVGLLGDSTRLNQVLTNLLANGIKFTEQGGVQLFIQQLAATPGGVRLRFCVQDTGIGIRLEEQARLFEPFTQADASIARRFGGTGLGLSIVKRLTTAMGGTVGLASTPDMGSEFCVELEFGLASPEAFERHAALPPPGQRVLLGAHVLVVDDSAINLQVAKRILEIEGARVSLACNGRGAYSLLQATPQAFDIVLMDVQMPVLDGYQATRLIRKELGLATLPILALTAGAMIGERQCAVEAGMDDLIAKPFDPRALALSVRRHVRRDLDAPATQVPMDIDPAVLSAPPWPVIEGIDAADVRLRLGGDVTLFSSLLRYMLDEFGDVGATEADADEATLGLQAARMHKLKGSAGTLGMRAVHRLAVEAETACRAGDVDRASFCARRLAVQLQALRANAVSFLSIKAEAKVPPDEGDADPHLLVKLRRLLSVRSFAALDHFRAASASLRRMLGPQAYETVWEHINKFEFEDASRLLESATACDGTNVHSS